MSDEIKVRIGTREMTIHEARQAMDPNIVARLQADHPHAEADQASAQAFADAYAEEHQRAHGQPFTGQR